MLGFIEGANGNAYSSCVEKYAIIQLDDVRDVVWQLRLIKK